MDFINEKEVRNEIVDPFVNRIINEVIPALRAQLRQLLHGATIEIKITLGDKKDV